MEFKECRKADEFIDFFTDKERGFRHTHFYHYSTLKNVDSILKKKNIRLTNLSCTSNDQSEREGDGEKGKYLFSTCFSTGTSEQLPLWYLYSGIDGKGARVGLSKSIFKKMYNSAKYFLQEVEKEPPYAEIGEPIELKKDYETVCQDIAYLSEDTVNTGKFRLKYNGQVKNDLSEDDYKTLKEKLNGFVKGLIWFYEKETRIRVEVKNTALIEQDKNYVVLLDLSNVYSDLNIRLAPEFKKDDKIDFDEYLGIKKFVESKIQKSDYAGEIKRNLKEKMCRFCDKNSDKNGK